MHELPLDEGVPEHVRGGMSRRQLMRAAAAAGAAAWTAPAILDSVSSAAFAAAASGCIRYYAKLEVSDDGASCYPRNPACNYTVPSGTRYVCCSSDVQNEPCPYPSKLPTMVTASTNSGYWEVTLQDGCYFPTTATWQMVGNWTDDDRNFNCAQMTSEASDAAGPNGQYSGNGYFQAGGRKGWVKKTRNSVGLGYVYTLFCCGS